MPSLLVLAVDTEALAEDALASAARIVLVFLIAYVVVRVIGGVVTPAIRVAVRQQMAGEPHAEVEKRAETLSHVVSRTTSVLVFVVALLTALSEVGVNVGPLIAGVGIVGLAVGFGAQNLVRDVINGLFILIENQYARGDVVRIGTVTGRVEDLNLRRTVVRDDDGAVHFIPHGDVRATSNLTRGFSRLNVNVTLPAGADVGRVFEAADAVGAALAADPVYGAMLREAPRALRVDKLAPGAFEVKIVGETAPGEQWAVTGELLRRLKESFEREGILGGR